MMVFIAETEIWLRGTDPRLNAEGKTIRRTAPPGMGLTFVTEIFAVEVLPIFVGFSDACAHEGQRKFVERTDGPKNVLLNQGYLDKSKRLSFIRLL
jgi:hypothetical protein